VRLRYASAVCFLSENDRFEKTMLVYQVLLQTRNNFTESYEMLKLVFRKGTVKISPIFDKFSNFKTGMISVNDAEYSGHPSASTADESVV
jgi:hypothetical protein